MKREIEASIEALIASCVVLNIESIMIQPTPEIEEYFEKISSYYQTETLPFIGKRNLKGYRISGVSIYLIVKEEEC